MGLRFFILFLAGWLIFLAPVSASKDLGRRIQFSASDCQNYVSFLEDTTALQKRRVEALVKEGMVDRVEQLFPYVKESGGIENALVQLIQGLPLKGRNDALLFLKRLQFAPNSLHRMRDGELNETGKLYLALEEIVSVWNKNQPSLFTKMPYHAVSDIEAMTPFLQRLIDQSQNPNTTETAVKLKSLQPPMIPSRFTRPGGGWEYFVEWMKQDKFLGKNSYRDALLHLAQGFPTENQIKKAKRVINSVPPLSKFPEVFDEAATREEAFTQARIYRTFVEFAKIWNETAPPSNQIKPNAIHVREVPRLIAALTGKKSEASVKPEFETPLNPEETKSNSTVQLERIRQRYEPQIQKDRESKARSETVNLFRESQVASRLELLLPYFNQNNGVEKSFLQLARGLPFRGRKAAEDYLRALDFNLDAAVRLRRGDFAETQKLYLALHKLAETWNLSHPSLDSINSSDLTSLEKMTSFLENLIAQSGEPLGPATPKARPWVVLSDSFTRNGGPLQTFERWADPISEGKSTDTDALLSLANRFPTEEQRAQARAVVNSGGGEGALESKGNLASSRNHFANQVRVHRIFLKFAEIWNQTAPAHRQVKRNRIAVNELPRLLKFLDPSFRATKSPPTPQGIRALKPVPMPSLAPQVKITRAPRGRPSEAETPESLVRAFLAPDGTYQFLLAQFAGGEPEKLSLIEVLNRVVTAMPLGNRAEARHMLEHYFGRHKIAATLDGANKETKEDVIGFLLYLAETWNKLPEVTENRKIDLTDKLTGPEGQRFLRILKNRLP